MTTLEEIERLRFASLLHDIGKFWQGTGIEGEHAKLSGDFVRKFFPDYNITFVASHHDSSQYLHRGGYKLLKMLVISDWLSSGERVEMEESGKRERVPLLSIFSEVHLEGRMKGDELYFLPEVYRPSRDIHPICRERIGDLTPRYRELWKAFTEEVDRLDKSEFGKTFESLLALLRKYCTFVPSAIYKTKPDVSLFDHLKTTCAIADCLYQMADDAYLDELLKALIDRKGDILDEERFILIGGDISGIQKFIYNVIPKGAVKGLKGRSLYLELLCELISRYIVERLNLSIANIIYCGGGHFYILAPINSIEKIERLREEIAEKLLDYYKGRLYLAIAYTKLSPRDFLLEDGRTTLADKWEILKIELDNRKKKKFAEIRDYSKLFDPMRVIDVCRVCGLPIEDEKERIEDENIIKCKLCKELEGFASKSVGKKYLILTEKGEEEDAFSLFGYKVDFANEIPKENGIKAVYCVNDTGLIQPREGNSFFFHLDTGTRDLDKLAERARGLEAWGVLKGDVDNLGKIFSKGLPNPTFSRMSNLSNLISLFFGGVMNEICRDFGEKVYGVYSGGDDFFIIGSWDILPELAREIHDTFRRFTGYNPSMTLSMAISIAPSKMYPVYRLAEHVSEELEEKAKEKEKDSLVFLGKRIRWKDFDMVESVKEMLKDGLEKGILSKGFLQRMYTVYNIYREGKEKVDLPDEIAKYDNRCGRWRWILCYMLARERNLNKERLDEWRRQIVESIDLLDVATRWVEFLERR
ncbi:MAG: type III-A CRISPR-associated protein Cas10/Csm1 [Thermoplasmata archaeon]|nr:MAG: type III-A CRISPR-associated protein Cas10/Csm1 [Thermoplasmata archaeon]